MTRKIALSFALVLCAAARAGAQSFDLEHLQLATGGGDFIATEGAGGRTKPWSYHTDVAYRYSDAQLVRTQGRQSDVLVGRRSLMNLTAGVQLGRWIGFGVDVPILLDQSGMAVQGGPAFGDLRMVPRVEILRGMRFGLALMTGLRAPTGDPSRFLGEGGVVFEPRVAAQLNVGMFRLGLNLGVRIRQHERQLGNVLIGHEVTAALAAAIVPHRRVDVVVELHADTALSNKFGSSLSSPVEVLAGLGLHAGPVRFGAAVGAGVVEGYGAPRFRFLATIQFQRQSSEPAPAVPVFIAKKPAPAPKKVVAPVAVAAAPAPAPLPVAPPPDELAPVVVPEPAPAPEIEIEIALVAAAPAPPQLSERQAVAEPVRFHLNSRRITHAARETLAAVATLLKAHPEQGTVWVEGHADEIGPAAWNQALSHRRAEAVVAFLIAQGVDASRLVPIGLGDDRPLDGSTATDSRNRCVAFFNRGIDLVSAVKTSMKGMMP